VFALEGPLPWQAAQQAPGEKRRHSWSVDMRQAATIGSHTLWWIINAIILKKSSGAEAPRRLKPALQWQTELQ
jgi:hypothetical protein